MPNIKNRKRVAIANLRNACAAKKAKNSSRPIALGNKKTSPPPGTSPTPSNVSTTTPSSALGGGASSTWRKSSSSPSSNTTPPPSGVFEVEPKLEPGESSLSEEHLYDSSSATCLVCQKVRGGEGNSGGSNVEESSPCRIPNEFPTCSEQDNCYREQLWSVFVLRKLLEVPRKEVAALLRNTFGVNPSRWIGLCVECSELVEVAVQLNYQIMKLERDLHKVKVEIQGKLSKSVELEEKPAIKEEDEGPGILNVHQVIRGNILGGNNYRKSGACPPACPATSSGFPLIDDDGEDEHFSATHHDVEDEVNSSDPEEDPLYDPNQTRRNDEEVDLAQRKSSPRKGRWRPRGPGLPLERISLDDLKTEDDNDDDEHDSTDPLFIPEESEELQEDADGINITDGERHLVGSSALPELSSCSTQGSRSNDDGPSKFKSLSKKPKLKPGKLGQGRNVRNNDTKKGKFVCSICKVRCHGGRTYGFHMNNHKFYPHLACRICSYPNSTETKLKTHLALKHGIGALPAFKLVDKIIVTSSSEEPGEPGRREGGRYQCKFCSYSSPLASRVLIHEETHKISDNISAVEGTTTGRFRCKLCGFEGRRQTIREHFVDTHASQVGMQPLLCHMCEKVYANETLLRLHLKMVHGDARHSCSVCGKGFTRARCFREHFEKCSNGGRNPVICDLCGTTFTCASQLKRHTRQFHSKGGGGGGDETAESGREPQGGAPASAPPGKRKRPTKCKHCGVQLVHDKALKQHFRTAHPELYKYKCEQCDAAYMQPGGIKTHMEAKHLKQKANCPHCYREFSCAAFLKGHWAKHCKKLPPPPPQEPVAVPPPEVQTASHTHNTNTNTT